MWGFLENNGVLFVLTPHHGYQNMLIGLWVIVRHKESRFSDIQGISVWL
jgi:hypothetical protein